MQEAKKAPGWEERERFREAAEKAHQQTLKRIDGLVEDFARIEGTAEATDVFAEMQRILAKEGIEPALAFLERRRADVFARAPRCQFAVWSVPTTASPGRPNRRAPRPSLPDRRCALR